MLNFKSNINHPIKVPSPIEMVDVSCLVGKECDIYIKRDDLIHPYLNGNKWRKLKYNIDHVLEHNLRGIVSFGGAFSNHIYAVAAASVMFDFKAVLYIRGEIGDLDNPTLEFCRKMGVVLLSLSREEYKLKANQDWLNKIQDKYPEFYIVPEGGTNDLAFEGVSEIMSEIKESNFHYDSISVSAGTGGTAGGMIKAGIGSPLNIYSSLKGDFMAKEVQTLLGREYNNWSVNNDYHLGGYAKVNKDYIAFLNHWYALTNIPLDPIYTGKMVYGIIDQLKSGTLDADLNHLVIHTGGLQGIKACNYLNGEKLGMIDIANVSI